MKVFGIGFQRTGTTSLTTALNMLGIKTKQFPKELHFDIEHEIIREFDGFTDNPIPWLYPDLDSKYPDSKFILTLRDESTWLKSVRWLFTTGAVKFDWEHNEMTSEFHTKLYGTTEFDENIFLERYRKHNQEVLAYFANRPNDLLVFSIEMGEGFEKLCPFLEKPIPENIQFPHRNKSEGILKVKSRKIISKLKSGVSKK